MTQVRFIISAIFVSVLAFEGGNGARILGVFPTTSISHQIVFRGLTLALNKRGHELVIATPNPVNDPNLKNYTEIDLSELYTIKKQRNLVDSRFMDWLSMLQGAAGNMYTYMNVILGHPEMRKLYALNNNEKFDVLIVEPLYWPAILALAPRFNVPIIGVSSLGLSISNHYSIGNPILPSHPSTWEFQNNIDSASTFWQRLNNFIRMCRYLYFYRMVYMPAQEAIAQKYLGDNIPSLADIEKNISLFFVNQQGPISFARPNVPGVVEIGGFHIVKCTERLPKDLQEILDDATQGFIYMSLGSNVESKMLSNETRAEFVAAFSALPYKVIWKFEDNVFPNKPDNVLILKWTPQQAILAHSNLKVFIYQGGLQSTEEAIHHGVPLIGLPVFADQDMQVDKMVSLGVAKRLEITRITRQSLLEAIHAIALDSSYKQKMLTLRSLLEEKPHDPLENAIWWTEYVIRNRGAPHLHSSSADEPWYQRQDMDIIAFISASSSISIFLALVILYRLLVKLRHGCSLQFLDAKKKMH
ncbi:UDP-glycosyltransferase UGT5 [Neodiprion lecontei]|uniref:UDP-glycosyltransferase UGT5 n=1 Tax=Neodiprion lecontei TaxID=441921 RepID=A0A6J0BFR5_NEOLC|nr:UDP-glycosyltransferase UGT5 [Neodiprion lecontei]